MLLEGKDFLTREEAAAYACVSLRHWDGIRKIYGIQPIPWAGKLIYRKTDIARAIDLCQQSANVAMRGSSAGGLMGASIGIRSGKSRRPKQTAC